jgi:hypothetical protein
MDFRLRMTSGFFPFYFIVSSLPLALYWLALAWLHGRRRPTLVTGRRDAFALVVATLGALFIGPLQILPGFSAWIAWGSSVWLLVAAFVVFVMIAVLPRLRPRFVVYNTTLESLRKTLSATAIELDLDARWSGDTMNMPGLGVEFYLDDSPRGRVTSIVAIGRELSPSGWTRLRDALDVALATAPPPPRRLWFPFLALATAILITDGWFFVNCYEQIVESIAFYLSV